LGKLFYKTFSEENSNFPQHFFGISAESSSEFSAEKNVRKIDPWWMSFLSKLIYNQDRGKSRTKIWAVEDIFKGKVLSPNWRKFAQSGANFYDYELP
jgi:hypothetical protein